MSLLVNLEKKYRDFTLNISFEGRGEPVGLLGASGCGKSLTLGCIAGIIRPDRGRIVLNDRVLFDSAGGINLSPRQRNIGMLFQNYALFPHMTVRENIGVGVRTKQRSKELIGRLLSLFRLEGLQDRYPGQLSGGEQQRTAMARMLAYEPEVLLLDEPFSALDSHLKEELQQELAGILRNYGGEFLMVSHNTEELYRFCDTIAVIERGLLLEYGSSDRIFEKPAYHKTALLTGCKNISRAVKKSEYEVEALDWKLCLQTDLPVTEEIRYVGIRPEALRGCHEAGTNRVSVTFHHSIAGPRDLCLTFRSKHHADSNYLFWTLPLKEWRENGHKPPDYLALPKEHLILMK